ncbi:hypothetical protein PSAB6_360083 [Paraburkholderia sabiae]|nr:hypothetical protein PSAB6_360083 [Paraburkholderia sabiae]
MYSYIRSATKNNSLHTLPAAQDKRFKQRCEVLSVSSVCLGQLLQNMTPVEFDLMDSLHRVVPEVRIVLSGILTNIKNEIRMYR